MCFQLVGKSAVAVFKTTKDILVPKSLAGQIVGQEKGVEIIRKAAQQKRHVLLLGPPGCGKSMLAQAMAEMLPIEKLEDVLIYPNTADPNNPKVRVVPASEGKKIIEGEQKKSAQLTMNELKPGFGSFFFISILFSLMIIAMIHFQVFSDIIIAAFIIVGGFFLGLLVFAGAFAGAMKQFKFGSREADAVPRLLVDNSGKKTAPFVDASGAHAGALLGDCLHDPLQSGGLGTPPHLRIQAGAIHKANKGVLFIDEIASLSPKSQQELLTAMQERKYSITGQSELSSGAQVRTEPVPCDFVLVASGNIFDLEKMHPALRSRIRGYGYEVYLNEHLDETVANKHRLEQFVAQEILKDGKIPHFNHEAVDEVVNEAKRRAGRKNKFTMRLRDLGGLVRAAGDIARTKNAAFVSREDVAAAKKLAQTLEQQLAEKFVTQKKEYEVIKTHGFAVGRVNGLAVVGDGVGQSGGMLLPIEAAVAEVAKPGAEREGKIIATGRLGDIAKEAVQNVSAVIKKYKGIDVSSFDIHVQFLQTYEGVEGDSASISVATAVLSALEDISIDQSVAMTGSLSVKGEVLPVGGVTAKAEAAFEAGVRTLILPEVNKADLVLSPELKKKLRIVPVRDLCDVLRVALKEGAQKKRLIKQIAQIIR